MYIKHCLVTPLNFIRDGVLNVFKEEKENLRRCFGKQTSRFNLRIELFNKNYRLTVVLFIDDTWELKKKIIRFQCAKDDSDFFETLKFSLSDDWKINKNMCTIVRSIGQEINSCFNKQGSLPFCRQLFPVDCLMDILNIWVGNRWGVDLATKMRHTLDYILNTSSNTVMFQMAVGKAKSMSKKVTSQGLPPMSIDKFELLEIAVGYKEAFCELEQMDPDFKLINLGKEEWDMATVMYECWELLNNTSCSFYENKYTTANVYFAKVCDIFMKILQWKKSEFWYVHDIAACMGEEFVRNYWNDCILVLVIAVILDPRFKMDIVKRWFQKIFDSDADARLKEIIDGVTNVYHLYEDKYSDPKLSTCDSGDAKLSSSSKMLDNFGMCCTSSDRVDEIDSRSELDRYLKDSKFPSFEEFDILSWWRTNSPTFQHSQGWHEISWQYLYVLPFKILL